MTIRLSVQVASWLHAQVVAGAGVDQVLPPLLRQGFDEVQARRIYNAVLADPAGFEAGFSRAAGAGGPVPHTLPGALATAPVGAAVGIAAAAAAPAAPAAQAPRPTLAPFSPAVLVPAGLRSVACDHGEVHVAFRLERPHVVLFEHVLTDAECDALIAEARPHLSRAEVVDSERGGTKVDARRTSQLAVVRREASPLVARLDARIATITGVPVPQGEPLQVMRYGVGAEYRPHYDYFDLERPGQAAALRNGGQRIASLVIYLNDVEAGGETTFNRCGLSVAPRRGSAVFFAYTDAQSRTDPMSFHAGAPVTAGEKWIATRWMREREFT